MKRASYRKGIEMIAMNDAPTVMDPKAIAYFTTSLLLADLFGVEPERVGRDVAKFRATRCVGCGAYLVKGGCPACAPEVK